MAGQDFHAFLEQRHAAAAAYVTGDPGPLGALVATEHQATFFSPRGDVTSGTREVATRYADDAQTSGPGSTNDLETIDSGAGDEVGFWVGRQRSRVDLEGHDDPVVFDLRVTEVYRREEGDWKLVHRHADPVQHDSD